MSADAATADMKVWPVEIRLTKGRDALKVSFDDGNQYELPAELLRVMSPSAEVRGHSEAERKTIGGKRNVSILSVDPVGNYAIKIGFDDMHATGLYTWGLLADLGRNATVHWQRYESELLAKNMSRDRPGQA